MPFSIVPWTPFTGGPPKLGAAGTVLTSNGTNAQPTFQAPGGGGGSGTLISYASPAGAQNNVAPAGFGAGVGRVALTLPSGNANWTGLTAGTDGQQLIITNKDAANTLTLNVANAGSLAANQFFGSADYAIPPGNSLSLCYYAGSVNQWVII
jgi:hypothetical protein